MKSIDLNADLGESFGPWKMGEDAQMMQIISSANIACGGHAGDNMTMFDSVVAAMAAGVSIGAHPGFEDRQGFGRRRLPLTTTEVERLVAAQTGALCGVAALAGAEVQYVKAHGALSNWACETPEIAAAIVRATRAVLGDRALLLAVSGTALETEADRAGLPAVSEVFADRGYTPKGQLVQRGTPGAMIHDADQAADRLISFLETGEMPTVGGDPVRLNAGSICVHGDGSTAVAMAAALRHRLTDAGFKIRSFV